MSKENHETVEVVGLSFEVAFERKEGRKRATTAKKAPKPTPKIIPYQTRMLALAYYFDELLRTGQVKNYAELARLGGVSRARITQIMNLLLLSSNVQEERLLRAFQTHS